MELDGIMVFVLITRGEEREVGEFSIWRSSFVNPEFEELYFSWDSGFVKSEFGEEFKTWKSGFANPSFGELLFSCDSEIGEASALL